MQKKSSAVVQASRTPLIVRASENRRNGNYALSQDFSRTIDIRQEHIEGPNPLLEPADNLAPFFAGENLGQQIAEPGVLVFAGWDFKRNSKLTQRRVQPLFQFP
jgi:hypothetical protein